MLYYFEKGKNATETNKKKIHAVYGEGAVTDRTCQKWFATLAGVAQWIQCQPENQRVAGSIPSQGTGLCCGPGPQLGACERQLFHVARTLMVLPLFLPPFPSKSKEI